MAWAVLGAVGAAIGSFVNVLAYRLPRHESVVGLEIGNEPELLPSSRVC